jgi:hypothetical protein
VFLSRSDTEKCVYDLEVKVKFAEACGVEISAEGEKFFGDFRSVLVQQLERLHKMYADKV